LAQSLNLKEADYLTTLSPGQLRDYSAAFTQRDAAVNAAANYAQTTLLKDMATSTAGIQRSIESLSKQLSVDLGDVKQHRYANYVGQSVAQAMNGVAAGAKNRVRP
jgi:hypothetical protein